MLNLGDIVKFNHANLYSVGEVVTIYKLKESNIKIEEDEEYKYDVETFDTTETFTISEKEVEKRYTEIVNCKFINPFESVAKVDKSPDEEEIPTIRLMEVFKLFKENESLKLLDKRGFEYEVDDIDERDFDTPFRIKTDCDECDTINYDDIAYLIYDDKKYKITQEITKREFNILCNKNVCIKLNGTSYSYNVLGIINDEIHLISEATTFYLKSTKVEVCFKEVKIID